MDTFAKIKLEASGYPKNCESDEQKQAYVDDILENQGIQLDPAKIAYNPGLRALAKLMLNSFWGKFYRKEYDFLFCVFIFLHFLGKFAQRSNLVKTEQIDDSQKFFDYLTSDEVVVLDADLVSDDIMELGTSLARIWFKLIPRPTWSSLRSPRHTLVYRYMTNLIC